LVCAQVGPQLATPERRSLFPAFSACWFPTMAATTRGNVPATPRVISPSPTLSDASGRDDYFPPVTRSAARKQDRPPPIDEVEGGSSSSSDAERRARTRSRSPLTQEVSSGTVERKRHRKEDGLNGDADGHLSPQSASTSNKDYWRSLSRSPSPLGLIPIHTQWRSFIHRHEIPRKILHLSIGFLTLTFYTNHIQATAIAPVLLSLLIPIFTVDVIRHRLPSFNRFYITVLGALMRESEVDGWNGVIWYLLGAFTVLRFFPKDVGVMGVLLLSWCDTAASTVGRRWGKYTPQVRRGKSLAGSLAALVCGVATAVFFWGWLSPRQDPAIDSGEFAFAFQGRLGLPAPVRELLGLSEGQAQVTGGWALGIMSLWTGFVASASEAVDLFGWDDNLTIPVLCGAGLWGFLKIFG
ncbi:cytidylyltransferase, partial [Saccharata proteae CBS 121410]